MKQNLSVTPLVAGCSIWVISPAPSMLANGTKANLKSQSSQSKSVLWCYKKVSRHGLWMVYPNDVTRWQRSYLRYFSFIIVQWEDVKTPRPSYSIYGLYFFTFYCCNVCHVLSMVLVRLKKGSRWHTHDKGHQSDRLNWMLHLYTVRFSASRAHRGNSGHKGFLAMTHDTHTLPAYLESIFQL